MWKPESEQPPGFAGSPESPGVFRAGLWGGPGEVTGAASCVADDKDLPSVPPLELSVPADYPAQSPLWIDRQWQYGG